VTVQVLHVEDDPDIREIVKMAFEFIEGFDLTQCENGADALDYLAGNVPDVLLLDVMMPGMDGMQLLTEARKNPALAEVPAIFMTARVQEAEIKPLYDAGGAGVIAKPFDPVALGGEIMKILDAQKG